LISPSSADSLSSAFTGAGNKGPGDRTVYLRALLEAFSNIFLRSASFVDEGFSGKKQNFQSFIMCQIIGISELSDTRSKNFAVYQKCNIPIVCNLH
jgi:hypothetical protein